MSKIIKKLEMWIRFARNTSTGWFFRMHARMHILVSTLTQLLRLLSLLSEELYTMITHISHNLFSLNMNGSKLIYATVVSIFFFVYETGTYILEGSFLALKVVFFEFYTKIICACEYIALHPLFLEIQTCYFR